MKHLYIILFVLPLIVFGQGWEQTYGGDENDQGRSVQQTTDGGYIITGTTHSFGDGNGFNIYLIKTDENGEEEWSQTFGGDGWDWGYSVQQTTDGGYVLTGYTTDYFNGQGRDVILIKTNENGEEIWSQTFGGESDDEGHSVQQTTDGGYIITGVIRLLDHFDVYLIKTDENGEEIWSQTFGGEESWDEGNSVQQTTDGGYIIIGDTTSPFSGEEDSSWNVYLIKTDSNGVEEWSHIFGGELNDLGKSIQQTTDGGYIITGIHGRSVIVGQGNNINGDVYLIKTNGDGEEEWSQILGGTEDDRGDSVRETTDGGYIISGHVMSLFSGFGDGSDILLIKTDEYGEEEWSQIFGETEGFGGYSVQQTFDGGYVICGTIQIQPQPLHYDIYLIKTDSEGNVENTSTIELPTPTSKRELVKTTNILGQENTTIKNQPLIEIYDDGSTEKKIVIE